MSQEHDHRQVELRRELIRLDSEIQLHQRALDVANEKRIKLVRDYEWVRLERLTELNNLAESLEAKAAAR